MIRPVDVAPVELQPAPPPEESVKPPENAAALLEEVDLLAALPKDKEIEMKPDVQEAEFALRMANPTAKGEPNAPAAEITSGFEIDSDDLPELGRQPEQIKPAEVGQITIDPGAMQADDDKLGKLTDAMIRLMEKRPFYGLQYRGTTYDCGDKVGFLAANVALALDRDDVGPGLRAALKKILAERGGL